MVICNVAAPQLLWSKKARSSVPVLFAVSILVNIGMWFERFVIIVVSLHRAFLPSAWGMFYPTKWDWMTLFGSIAMFVWLFLLFVRVLPSISMAEMRELVDQSAKGES
jgi:molybdopterin-containing oxidoreductase family membrane subunit